MTDETMESNEKLEQIEQNALEDTGEISPLEDSGEILDNPESIDEPSMEMSTCSCTGNCGSNYSYGNCACTGGCGSNYHK